MVRIGTCRSCRLTTAVWGEGGYCVSSTCQAVEVFRLEQQQALRGRQGRMTSWLHQFAKKLAKEG